MKIIKNEKLFLVIDYDLFGIIFVIVNGEIYEVKFYYKIVYFYL